MQADVHCVSYIYAELYMKIDMESKFRLIDKIGEIESNKWSWVNHCFKQSNVKNKRVE